MFKKQNKLDDVLQRTIENIGIVGERAIPTVAWIGKHGLRISLALVVLFFVGMFAFYKGMRKHVLQE